MVLCAILYWWSITSSVVHGMGRSSQGRLSILMAFCPKMLCYLSSLSLSPPEQFGYHQVALSSQSIYMNQNTNSYSHDHPYPLQQRFFIEQKTARGAIKCDVAVSDASHQKLASCLVLPYSPTSKDTTPEPSRAANTSSIPSSRSSTRPPSPTGNHSLLPNRQPPMAGAVNYPQSNGIGTMVWVILFICFCYLSLYMFVSCVMKVADKIILHAINNYLFFMTLIIASAVLI